MYRHNTPTKRKYIKLTKFELLLIILVTAVLTLTVRELWDLKML